VLFIISALFSFQVKKKHVMEVQNMHLFLGPEAWLRTPMMFEMFIMSLMILLSVILMKSLVTVMSVISMIVSMMYVIF
jgi:hypothetical protein